ncbi:MAG: hypothetical protein RCO49_06615 [Rickettsia endosymbiont of Argas persicus]
MRLINYSDVFQFIIIMLAIPATCFIAYGLESRGGIIYWHKVFEQLPKNTLTPDINKENIVLFFSLILFSLLPKTRTPYIQRFLISRNSKQLVTCTRIIAALTMFFIITIGLIGFLVKAMAPNINPNMTLLYFIDNYLHIGIKGIVMLGIATLMTSTASAFLNSTSMIIVHDIKYLTQKQALIFARVSICIIAVLFLTLSLSTKGVMELLWLSSNFWEAIILVPLTAGFLKFRTNARSFITSVAFAIVFTCIGAYVVGKFATISLLFGIIGSSIGLFGMHYLQKYHGINPAEKHIIREQSNQKSNIGYANSRDQIEEWYKKGKS